MKALHINCQQCNVTHTQSHPEDYLAILDTTFLATLKQHENHKISVSFKEPLTQEQKLRQLAERLIK